MKRFYTGVRGTSYGFELGLQERTESVAWLREFGILSEDSEGEEEAAWLLRRLFPNFLDPLDSRP